MKNKYNHPNGPDDIPINSIKCKCGGSFTYCEVMNNPLSASCERCHASLALALENEPNSHCSYSSGSELARVLLMHVVDGIFQGCGNSYANSYTEEWLTRAKELGAYHGRVIGRIHELQDEWGAWLDDNGGLPDFPPQNTQMNRAKGVDSI